MGVDTIKAAITQLSEDERHSLAAWLHEMEYDEWDKQMSKDFSPGGRGERVVEKIKRGIAEGKARPMHLGPAKRGKLRA